MSAFFANLLSRSRGTADVVRPRLASLFEPGEPRPSHLAGEPSADAEQDVDDAPFAEGRANTAAPAAASFASQGLTQSHAGELRRAWQRELGGHDINARDDSHADPDTRGAARSSGRWDGSGDARRSAGGHLGIPADGDGRGAHERSDRAGHGHHAAALAGLEGGARDASGNASLIRGATPARAMRAAMDALVEGGVPRGSHGAVAGDSPLAPGAAHAGRNAAPIGASMPSSPPTLIPTPAPAPRFRFEPSASRPRAGAGASEPIIEISIGRIDVRAAVERGSNRKAAAAPSPVMDLDEYLKTRARGGSR